MISNKRIAVLAVKSFSIEGLIVSGLKSLGAQVSFYDERPSNHKLSKVWLRIFPRFYQRRIRHHFSKILKITCDENFDFWFILRGETVPKWFIDNIRSRNTKTKIIYYTADSVANNPSSKFKVSWFDKSYSFDPKDCVKYGFDYMPLFYDPDLELEWKPWDQKKYDLTFFGTLHSDRQVIVSKLMRLIPKSCTSFIFYFSHAWWVSLYMIRYGLKFKADQLRFISTKSIERMQMCELLKNSRIVLDIHHPGQSGLTLRTIEALAAGCKLLTTNDEIKNHSFYDYKVIQVFDRSNPTVSLDFLTRSVKMDNQKIKYLRLDNWLLEILK